MDAPAARPAHTRPADTPPPGAARHRPADRPVERPLRLASGLLLFAFVVSHFLTHASGLLLLPAMEQARTVLLWPWRTLAGEALLVAAILTHGGLGLWALYRRRHLRMPASEAWQLGLGLCIPILLIPHGLAGLLSDDLFGEPLGYPRALFLYWIAAPERLLPRQFLLLLIVWLHGCIGVRAWLLVKPWYRRHAALLGALALSLPLFAMAGIVNAGWDTERRAAAEPGFAERYGPPEPSQDPAAARRAALAAWSGRLVNGYVLLLAGTIGLRQWRNWQARRANPVRIAYPNQRVVVVPRGTSVLEASRAAGIPHTALCGGRGRCSTCRVRVTAGVEALPPPNPTEAAVLARMKAPAGVRLACQLRPTAALSVTPLVAPAPRPAVPDPAGAVLDGGRELPITALFVDLRGSTSLAAARLPFDALFIVGRYIQVVTDAVRRHDGYVIAVAGDGVMAMFADDADPGRAAANALGTAAALWAAVEDLSRELADDLEKPLGVGIGIHAGLAVVGALGGALGGAPGHAEAESMQFIGDTGNVAARLEELTKELGATVIVSDAAAVAARCRDLDRLDRRDVAIRGREGTLTVHLARRRADLLAVLPGRGA